MNLQNKVNQYPMKELGPIICEFLNSGKNVEITARGNSMRPMLKNLKDRLTISPVNTGELSVGDVIFYRRESGVFVVHRIVDKCENGNLILMGDFQVAKEEITPSAVLGKVTAFVRNNKAYATSHKGYQAYVKFWVKTRFWRKVYMSLSYRLGRVKYE